MSTTTQGRAWELQAKESLRIALSCAVPLWIRKLQTRDISEIAARARCTDLGKLIAERGDIIMFRCVQSTGGTRVARTCPPVSLPKSSGTAEAFNQLAEALATLALMPGGVTFLGDHYEAKHEGWKPRPLAKTRGHRA